MDKVGVDAVTKVYVVCAGSSATGGVDGVVKRDQNGRAYLEATDAERLRLQNDEGEKLMDMAQNMVRGGARARVRLQHARRAHRASGAWTRSARATCVV